MGYEALPTNDGNGQHVPLEAARTAPFVVGETEPPSLEVIGSRLMTLREQLPHFDADMPDEEVMEAILSRDDQAFLQGAYDLVHESTVRGLVTADYSGEAAEFADQFKEEARPRHMNIGFTGGSGKYVADERRLVIALDKMYAEEPYLKNHGFTFHHPDDGKLINILHTFAHEDAHSVLHAAGRAMKNEAVAVEDEEYLASKALLANHPEHALTGNWDNDSHIFNEALAENMACMDMDVMLEALGYDPDERKQYRDLTRQIKLENISYGKPGTSQVDHLSAANEHVGLPELTSPEAVRMQQNPGLAGYPKVFDRKEIAGFYQEMSTMAKDGEVYVNEDSAEWNNTVHKVPLYRRIGQLLFISVSYARLGKKA